MTASKKLTLNADGTAATVSEPAISDVVTTIIDSNVALTGMYGLAQKAGLFVAGMAVQNWRVKGALNPFS